ncbi:MAG: hypothetical protein KatS3mg092_0792 [Patescibacteria group bacterium]|nr:MAG: hypothetical protein KatS3mg092_0792 [Patescibacteria group bacterium]
MGIILILGFFLRLLTIFVFKNIDNYDIQSYYLVGKSIFEGIKIYPDIAKLHHPYLPFFLYIEYFAYIIGKNKLIISIIIRFVNTFFDIGNIYLIYLLSKSYKKAFLYAINPISILIFCLHGQFDAIPIFFLLLTIYFLQTKKQFISMIFYSLAILIKTWPILFMFLFLKRLKNRIYIFLALLFPVISILVFSILFKNSFINILKTILGYQSVWGVWGWSILLQTLRFRYQKIMIFLFLIVFYLISYLKNNKDIKKEILFLLIIFIIFSPTFSIQYFSWIIPFFILNFKRQYIFPIFLITFYLIFNYASWVINIKMFYFNLISFVFWFILAINFLKIYFEKKLLS